ncbi:MAG: hypothetical protein JW750_03190 [Anaerolineaceae bacterium]|nr:hypothetical protein [Anaerolineaceae bacterium]
MSTTNMGKDAIKKVLGYLPMTAEMYYILRQQGRPLQSRFSLQQLDKNLPKILNDAEAIRSRFNGREIGKKVFIFATLHYWIEHAALMGISLSALGNDVTLAYLPYSDWRKEMNTFDQRQQNVYARQILTKAEPMIQTVPFLRKAAQYRQLSDEARDAVIEVSQYDVQYTLRNEDVDTGTELYRLRLARNTQVARAALNWFEENRPDVVIVPNGTIQELGVVYRMAKLMNIDVVTYEFSDKRDHMWLAQNQEVMRQDTEALWEARKDRPLSEDEWDQVKSLFSARQNATLWENFSRLWQGTAAEGGDKMREKLGLDQRPVVLLATNVLGDSLTLGRNIFSHSMAEWISRTVQYFAGRPDIQFVIRVHPGELITKGQSMVDVVKGVFPVPPDHIKLIEPDQKVNTYDIMEIADLGLVYTTTVGLEMAMSGKPVIVVGDTHYRNRGFTHDPDSWVSYYKTVGRILTSPQEYQLSKEKVEAAWRYAYSFFFEYSRPYPWHLVNIWQDYKSMSLANVFSAENFPRYEPTFKQLLGEPMNWEEMIGES